MRLYRHNIQIEPEFDTPSLRKLLEDITLEQAVLPGTQAIIPDNQLLKQDVATTIWRLEHDAQALVVKRYNTRNIWHAIRRSVRRSRAQNCWQMSKIFTLSGIDAPPRVAVIQEWLGPLKLRSWFINRYISGVDLDKYLYARDAHRQPEENRIKNVYDDVDHLFKNLKENRLVHGDLKATNILLSDKGLVLIDLDAAHQYEYSPGLQRGRRKDWNRFMKNWQRQKRVHAIFEEIKTDLFL